MLRGETGGRASELRLDRLSTFGVLAGRSQEEVTGILRALIAAGWVDLTTGDYPVPFLTEAGWKVMKGDVPARMRLPRVADKARVTAKAKPARSARSDEAPDAPRALPAAKRPETAKGGEVFEALRAKRAEVAKQQGVPAYVIAHDSVLAAIADRRPRSRRCAGCRGARTRRRARGSGS
jgi:ATP-dependent DNA helicase RecQ